MQLLQCPESGELPDGVDSLPEMMQHAAEQGEQHQEKVAYTPPWVGYLAVIEGAVIEDPDGDSLIVVGGCGFKGPPTDQNEAAGLAPEPGVRRVEIAYFTLPDHEGQGHATAMARELVRLSLEADSSVVVAAQTLREEGPSTSILKKLGFQLHAELIHPEDGEVWEWRVN